MKTATWFRIVAVLMVVSLALFGCTDKTTNVAQTSGAVASQGKMVGTVQGVLLDATTYQPIVGAVIDIGVAQAVTTANGQFVLRNVPATEANIETIANPGEYDSVYTNYYESYYVTINLKNVTSPVNMAVATSNRYSDYVFETMDVHYETIANVTSTGSGTCCSTFITNVQDVSTVEFYTGKLAATIKGYVAGCYSNDFFAGKGAGYTVSIVPTSGLWNTGTGNSDHVIATATTGTDSSFTFSNIESGESFWICAKDAANTMYGCADGIASSVPVAPNFRPGDSNMNAVTAPNDGETLILNIQNSNAVHVCPTDRHGPVVTAISVENGSDLTPGNQSVVFTFSEPIKQTTKTVIDATTIGAGGQTMYDLINVTFAGVKAGNVDFTLAWNTTYDQLTVSFPTAASSKYYVKIPNIDGLFADAVGNAAALGVCADDGTAPYPAPPAMYGIVTDAGANDCTVWFTTNGGATAANATIVINNAAVQNWNATAVNTGATSNQPDIDWLPVSGAKGYNVYRRLNQVFSDPTSTAVASTNSHGWQRLTASPITATAYQDAALPAGDYVENSVTKLTFDYYVTTINADGRESTGSNTATAADVIAPELTSSLTNLSQAEERFDVTFNEPMREGFAEQVANYTFATVRRGFATPTGVATARATSATAVRLWFTGNEFAITSGATLACNTTADPLDVQRIPLGQSNDCVSAGPNGALATVTIGGDDVACGTGICGGPNGLCETTANAGAVAGAVLDDVQITAVNQPTVCISAGVDNILQSTINANDAACGTSICPGADGYCNSTILGTSDDQQRVSAGQALVFKCVTEGTDGILQTAAGAGDVVTQSIQQLTVGGVYDVSNNLITTARDTMAISNATAAGTVD